MAGIATLSSTLGMTPNIYTFKLDDANATTGLLLNWRNKSGLTCAVQVGWYIVTQAGTGTDVDLGVTTTSGAQATTITDGGTGTTGTIYWTDGCDVIADGSYLTAYNVSSSTPAVATSLVGYMVIKTWPVCSVT